MRFHFSKCPIIVPVLLSGPSQNSLARLLLDTGAAVTIINSNVLKIIGVDPSASRQRVILTTADGHISRPLIEVPAVTFLGIRREMPLLAAHDLPSNAMVDGLLGTDLLAGLTVTIDFAANELEIRRS